MQVRRGTKLDGTKIVEGCGFRDGAWSALDIEYCLIELGGYRCYVKRVHIFEREADARDFAVLAALSDDAEAIHWSPTPEP